jgi:hypothetical protein
VSDRGWSTSFDDPIPLPRGHQLVTLQDAAGYIMKLPKAEQKLEEWQTATGCLIGARGRPRLPDARPHWRHEGLEPKRRASVQSRSQGQALGPPQAEARRVMDIYDEADWTEIDIEDLKAAIEGGASMQEAADLLCPRRWCRGGRAQMRGTRTEARVAIMTREACRH